MTPCLWKAARLSLLATLLWGCAILPPGAEPLQVTLSDVRLVDATLLEQTYRLRLRLNNPNPFDVDIVGLQYTLEMNGRDFASGVSNQQLTVPQLGSAQVDVDAVSSLAGIYRQIIALQQSKDTLTYRMRGALYVQGGGKLSFDQHGEVGLGGRDS